MPESKKEKFLKSSPLMFGNRKGATIIPEPQSQGQICVGQALVRPAMKLFLSDQER